MITVSQLAKQHRISRTTVLYYERVGLLKPHSRSASGYRWYGDAEIGRLQAILAYRSYGVPVAKLTSILDRDDDLAHELALQEQFKALEAKIQTLRQQQQAIVMLFENPEWSEPQQMTKDRWVEILRASGMDDVDMHRWHQQFETMEPTGHEAFLKSLNIDPQEIMVIRQWSKSAFVENKS